MRRASAGSLLLMKTVPRNPVAGFPSASTAVTVIGRADPAWSWPAR